MDKISRIIDIAKTVKDIAVEINKDSKLILDIGFSSFEMCLLVCELESQFQTNIDFGDIDNSVTVAVLNNLLERKEKS